MLTQAYTSVRVFQERESQFPSWAYMRYLQLAAARLNNMLEGYIKASIMIFSLSTRSSIHFGAVVTKLQHLVKIYLNQSLVLRAHCNTARSAIINSI